MNEDGRLAGGGERQFQVFIHAAYALFNRRSVGDGEVVVAALQVAGETFVEHDEFRTIRMRSGILRPIRRNFPREGGIAGKDQDGRAVHTHRRFLALCIGLRGI